MNQSVVSARWLHLSPVWLKVLRALWSVNKTARLTASLLVLMLRERRQRRETRRK